LFPSFSRLLNAPVSWYKIPLEGEDGGLKYFRAGAFCGALPLELSYKPKVTNPWFRKSSSVGKEALAVLNCQKTLVQTEFCDE